MEASALIEGLSEAVIVGDKDKVGGLVRDGLAQGQDPLVLFAALTAGIEEVGRRFEVGDYFIPDLVIGGNAMKAGADLISVEISRRKVARQSSGRLLIGTVKTDLHDIGKNLVALMFQVNGFEVVDLGVNVPVERFVEAVREERPQIVGLSTLLTVGMQMQAETLKALSRAGLRKEVIVLVGGAPVNQRWADEIGADGYASNAVAAVGLAKRLLQGQKALGE
ncbi:MAG: corrinoid protein [Chloroflexota bacterium]